jgi:pyruvate kinase
MLLFALAPLRSTDCSLWGGTATARHEQIVCTVGPSSWDVETLGRLVDAGMNVMRLNFSHGDHEVG